MTHWLIGGDASNGVHNYSALKQRKDGTFQRRKDFSITSVRGAVSTAEMDADVKTTDFDWYGWHDIKYSAGDTALEHAIGAVQPVSGRARYGGEAQLFLLAVAMYELGVKDTDTVDLCLLAPPADANATTGDKYRDGLAKFDNQLTINKNGGKDYTYTITSLAMFPETVAASFAAQYDDAGIYQREENPMRGAVMLVDGGRVTLDRLVFRNGKVDKLSIQDATNDRLGIGSMVLRPAARWIRQHLDRVYHDGAEELVDRAIRNPKQDANGNTVYWLSRMGETPSNAASVAITQAIANYHSNVQRFLSAEALETNTDKVLLCGGVAHLIFDRLADDFEGRLHFIDLEDYAHLRGVDPSFMNSVGAVRYLLKRMQ